MPSKKEEQKNIKQYKKIAFLGTVIFIFTAFYFIKTIKAEAPPGAPDFEFTSPTPSQEIQTVKGTQTIKGVLTGANSSETQIKFYIASVISSSGPMIVEEATCNEASQDWEYQWDTTKSNDGQYSIKAVIFSIGGNEYQGQNILTVEVANSVNIPTTPTISPSFSFSYPSQEDQKIQGIVTIKGSLSGGTSASQIELFIQPDLPNPGNPIPIGIAIYNSNYQDWEYQWDTTKNINGKHYLIAKIQGQNDILQKILIEIINPDTTIPSFEFTYPAPTSEIQKVQGNVIIKGILAGTNHHYQVRFFITPVSSTLNTAIEIGIGLVEYTSTSQNWWYQWNTTKNNNGRYYLTVKIIHTELGTEYNSQQKVLIEIINPIIETSIKPSFKFIYPAPTIEIPIPKIQGITVIKGKLTATNQNDYQITFSVTPISSTSNSASNSSIFIGEANYNIANQGWEYEWNTIKNNNGKYYLGVKILKNTDLQNYQEIPIEIVNQTTEPTTEVTPISETTKPAPETQTQISISSTESTENQPIEQIQQSSPRQSTETQQTEIEQLATQKIIEIPKDIDYDKDGLPDDEEKRLGTDPKNPDSDNDGYLDGNEALTGYDPLTPASTTTPDLDRINYEDLRETRPELEKPEIYQVEKFENIELPDKKIVIKFSGKAPPFIFVTLYIYSDLPIVVTVKTDANGNWEYILDKELENGKHLVYVTVTNNRGKVTAKSSPLSFAVKEVKAITIDEVEAKAAEPPVEKAKKNYMLIGSIVIILALLIAIIIIGIIISRQSDQNIQ